MAPSASGPSGPDRPRALSERERAILAGIEQDLDADSPELARAMAQAVTTTAAVPPGLVRGGLLVAALFAVLAVAGLVPAAVWALLGAVASMVLVPWVMLGVFDRLDRRRDGPAEPP
jgi:hypothetical protein